MPFHEHVFGRWPFMYPYFQFNTNVMPVSSLIWTGSLLVVLMAATRQMPPTEHLPDITPATRNAQVYRATCACCHALDGRGVAPWNPPLRGSIWLRSAPDDAVVALMLHGGFGKLNPGSKSYGVMPSMAWLGDDDLASAASHVRREFTTAPRDIDAAFVSSIRRRFAGRQQPWSAKELFATFSSTTSTRFTLSP